MATSSNPFDLAEREYQASLPEKKNDNYFSAAEKQYHATQQPKPARHLMQAAKGAAKGALYASPAGVPLAIADIAIPGAIAGALKEEIASEQDMPESIKKALNLPGINPQIASKAAFDLYNKATGGEGIVGGAVSAPFRAVGIESKPQSIGEETTGIASEFFILFLKQGIPLEQATKMAIGAASTYASGRGLGLEELPATIGAVPGAALSQAPKIIEEAISAKSAQKLSNQLMMNEPGAEILPQSFYESSEKALSEMRAIEAQQTPKLLPKPQPIAESEGKSLAGRVTPHGEDLGLRPPKSETPKNIEDGVGRVFSRDSFKNTTEGGKSIKNEVMRLDEEAYRDVNRKYAASREANSAISEIHPNLANTLEDKFQELKRIPEPSGPQKQLITSLENIVKDLVESEEGKIIGYKPINNQVLIDQVQSLRQKVDYDFAHGNAKNIFRPTIDDIQISVRNAAVQSGNEEALQKFDIARESYRDWVTNFDNDYIRPIRDIQNKDYSKMFKQSLDVDEFSQINSILQKSEQGKKISDAAKRELVEKYVGKYLEAPPEKGLKELNKQLKELEGVVITPEEANEVRKIYLQHREPQPIKFKATKADNQASKLLNMEPKDVQKLFDSRSGIKEARELLSKSSVGKERFEELKRQKIKQLLQEGKVSKKATGKDLEKVLNQQDKFEIFSELIGEKETQDALNLAKEIGKREILKANIGKVAKAAGAVKAVKILWPLFP